MHNWGAFSTWYAIIQSLSIIVHFLQYQQFDLFSFFFIVVFLS